MRVSRQVVLFVVQFKILEGLLENIKGLHG